MNIDVFVEPVAGNGYVAKSGEPLPLRAEGATEEEALAKLKSALQLRMNTGRLVSLPIGPEPHQLAKFAGIFPPDDPIVQKWLEVMAENRRQADQDDDSP